MHGRFRGVQISVTAGRTRSYTGTDLYIMSRDGSSQRRLAKGFAVFSGIAWSPSGSHLAMIGGEMTDGDATSDPGLTLYVIRADGTDRRKVTSGAGIAATPAWGPTGG